MTAARECGPTQTPGDVDIPALRAKYRQEREKRLRRDEERPNKGASTEASNPALTKPSPAPQRAERTISWTLPVSGLAVNRTPLVRASIMR